MQCFCDSLSRWCHRGVCGGGGWAGWAGEGKYELIVKVKCGIGTRGRINGLRFVRDVSQGVVCAGRVW